jgi:hypothetical protein
VPRRRTACVVLLAAAASSRVAADDDGSTRDVGASIAALASADEGARRVAAAAVERWFASAPPAERPGAVARLASVLRSRDPLARAAAVAVAGRVDDAGATSLWTERLDPEEDDRVLLAALDAPARRPPGSHAERAIVAALRDDRATPARRALLLEALGACDGPAAHALLRTPRAGGHWLEESGRALGLLRRGDGDDVPVLVAMLGHADPAVRVHAWEALTRITRESLPAQRAPWVAWWAARGRSSAGTASPASAATPAGEPARYADATAAHVPTYYGIPIARPKSRVVFCLDVSASMNGAGIDRAQQHLVATIKELPTTYAFELVCFQEKVSSWEGRLARAHPVVKERAIAFLAAQDPVSFTNLYDAIERAFAHAGRGRHPAADAGRLDAVFVLSDGAPNRGRFQTPDAVVEAVAALSTRTVPVHTVGAGESVAPLLRRIAEATGGTFVNAGDFE